MDIMLEDLNKEYNLRYVKEKLGGVGSVEALEGTKKEDFVLFLTHNPEYFEQMSEDEKEKTDMILAGHSHAGQVTFFGKIIMSAVKDKKKYGYGMKEYDGHKIYTTSGVGGGAFEMFIRFFAQPEIVVLKLKKIN